MARKPKTKAAEAPPSGTTEIVTWRPIAELRAYERNSRTHGKAQIDRLRGSFREFGWVNPILVQADGTIVAGHARVEAAKLEGFTTAKCLEVSGMSPEQVRAYVIADNRLALDAGWDEEMLRLEFSELEAAGYDTTVVGFKATELDELVKAIPSRAKRRRSLEPRDGDGYRAVTVHFPDAAALEMFGELTGLALPEGLRSVWFQGKGPGG